MTTTNISHEIHGAAPRSLFEIISMEQDAQEWANLLHDFLGPENDVYTRLRQRSGAETNRPALSS